VFLNTHHGRGEFHTQQNIMASFINTNPLATKPMTEAEEMAGYMRLLRAIKRPNPAEHVNHRKLARYVLQIASTEKPWSARCAVLKAAARAIAPELFE
jgi:hypothetical protein